MKIHRYIYTRLEKEASPRGKSGFQSAYWPEKLLDSGQILDLEANIHYPENLGVSGKNALFYQTVGGQEYLVVLYLFPQPDATDSHGRGGIFLCEGFLIEEADWKQIPHLLDLIDFLEDKPFRKLEKLFASADVDQENGTIAPLEFSADAGYWQVCAKRREEECEADLLITLYHQAIGLLPDQAILLQGESQMITERLAVAASYLPLKLRNKVCWDDTFDGGKVFFSQMKVFGFSEFPSVGGKQIRFAKEGSKAEWTDASLSKYALPSDLFAKWLMEVSDSPAAFEKTNAVFALAEAMKQNTKPSSELTSDPIFEAVNKDAVEAFFEERLGEKVGNEWAKVIAQMIPLHEKLGIWIAGFPDEKLQRPLLAGILHRKIGPSIIEKAPPEALIASDNAGLRLMNSMWTGKVPEDIDFKAFGESEVCDWLRLMLLEGDHSEYYMQDMLPKCIEFLRLVTRDKDVAEKLQPYILRNVPAQFSGFAGEVATMAIRMGEFGSIVDKETDWNFLTERWLVEEGGDLVAWKAIKKMAKDPGIENYVILRAFAWGEEKIPIELEHSSEGRNGFLNALIEVHGFNESQLMLMGFFGVEIKATGANFGLFSKLKRRFLR